MKNLGSHHPHLALPLVPELLCLHPYFDTPEPDMDDAACILLVQKQTRSFGLAFKYLHVSQPIDGKLLNIIISFKTGVYKYFGQFS